MKSEIHGVSLYYCVGVGLFTGLAGGPYHLENNRNVSIDTIEEFRKNIITPFQAVQNRQNATMINELIWGTHNGFGGAIAIGVKGTFQNLESTLNDLFNSKDGMGLPFLIYAPNKIFSQNDTLDGIELTKSVLASDKRVKKVKKTYLLFPGEFKYRIIAKED